MADSPLNHIPDVDKLDPSQAIQPGEQGREVPEEGKFAQHMKPDADSANPVSNHPSPMQVNAQNRPIASEPPTMASIQRQMEATSGSLGDIKNQLHTKNLKLKQSDKYLLRNKLSQANEHIRSAAGHVGVDTPNRKPDLARKNPIEKFLTLVSDGQHQLNSAAEQIRDLDTSGKHLNAGELLLVQVKLQKAQQELDYSSVILGKAIDVIKTLFNVQI